MTEFEIELAAAWGKSYKENCKRRCKLYAAMQADKLVAMLKERIREMDYLSDDNDEQVAIMLDDEEFVATVNQNYKYCPYSEEVDSPFVCRDIVAKVGKMHRSIKPTGDDEKDAAILRELWDMLSVFAQRQEADNLLNDPALGGMYKHDLTS